MERIQIGWKEILHMQLEIYFAFISYLLEQTLSITLEQGLANFCVCKWPDILGFVGHAICPNYSTLLQV